MIDWLNANEGAVTLLAGLSSSAVAIFAIVFSWRSAREAQEEQRRANERARQADDRSNELAYQNVRAEIGALLSITGRFHTPESGEWGGQQILSYQVFNVGKTTAEALEAQLDLGGEPFDVPQRRDHLDAGGGRYWRLNFRVTGHAAMGHDQVLHVEPPPTLTVAYHDPIGRHEQTYGPEAKRRAAEPRGSGQGPAAG